MFAVYLFRENYSTSRSSLFVRAFFPPSSSLNCQISSGWGSRIKTVMVLYDRIYLGLQVPCRTPLHCSPCGLDSQSFADGWNLGVGEITHTVWRLWRPLWSPMVYWSLVWSEGCWFSLLTFQIKFLDQFRLPVGCVWIGHFTILTLISSVDNLNSFLISFHVNHNLFFTLHPELQCS